MARKASELIAEPTEFAARLDPGYTEIICREEGKPDIRVRVKPLTYMQRIYCDGVKVRGLDKDTGFSPESIAEFITWTLRFGIDSVEGADWRTEARRLAGREYQCGKLECIDALPAQLQDAAFTQIQRVTELSESEAARLDFTSPLRGETEPSATANAA